MPVNEQSNEDPGKFGLWISAAYVLAVGALALTGLDTEDVVNAMSSISLNSNIELGAIIASGITLIGISIATYLVVKQIKQEDIKIRSQNIEEHVFGAANTVLAFKVPEGYFIEYNETNRYIAAWRYDEHRDIKRNVVSVHFNLLVQPLLEGEQVAEVIDNLCNMDNSDRWRYRIVVSKIEGHYGPISEIDASRGLVKMSDNFYKCVILSMKRLQLSNYSMLTKYQKLLMDTPLKEANDALFKENVFTRPAANME